jgi:hypothetical protein
MHSPGFARLYSKGGDLPLSDAFWDAMQIRWMGHSCPLPLLFLSLLYCTAAKLFGHVFHFTKNPLLMFCKAWFSWFPRRAVSFRRLVCSSTSFHTFSTCCWQIYLIHLIEFC